MTWLRRPTPFGALAAGAVLLALLMLIGGGGHTIAVVGSTLRFGKAYDFRFAALVTNGAILIYVGLTNLLLSRWIARAHRWALAWSAAVTGGLALYGAILLPLPTARDAAGPVLALSLGYLCWLGIVWRTHRTSARDAIRTVPLAT